jgi:hypothetical protein
MNFLDRFDIYCLDMDRGEYCLKEITYPNVAIKQSLTDLSDYDNVSDFEIIDLFDIYKIINKTERYETFGKPYKFWCVGSANFDCWTTYMITLVDKDAKSLKTLMISSMSYDYDFGEKHLGEVEIEIYEDVPYEIAHDFLQINNEFTYSGCKLSRYLWNYDPLKNYYL